MVSKDEMSSSESSSPTRQMTVVDVYDLASVIGKDFEQIIDHFGADSVVRLMPKVISALELLETFATRNERENEEIISLKATIKRLEAEKEEKKEGRQKFEMEMEQMEDNYRVEIRQLWDMVQKHQEENKRLLNNLEQKVESPTQALKEEDFKVMLTLQETIDKHRDLMKSLQRDCDTKSQEVEILQRQLEKIQRSNKELNRKNKAVQNQGRALIEEKVDLISLLQDREQLIVQLQTQLGETEKAKKDLEETKTETPVDGDHLPRFTLAELREVLQEKNQLKAKVMELEEELAQLRPAPTPSPNTSEVCDKTDDEDLVVYGPINREPEEKLFPWKYHRKDSGVRKFLLNMFRKSEQRSKESANALLNSSGTTTGLNFSAENDDLQLQGLSSFSSASSSKRAPAAEAALSRPDIAPPVSSVRPSAAAIKRVNIKNKNHQKSDFVVRYNSRISNSSAKNLGDDKKEGGENEDEEIEEPLEFSLTDDSSDSSAGFRHYLDNRNRRNSSFSQKNVSDSR